MTQRSAATPRGLRHLGDLNRPTDVHDSGADAALRAYMTLLRLETLLTNGEQRIAASRAAIDSSRRTLERVRRGLRGFVRPRGHGNLAEWDARERDESVRRSDASRRASST